ncbi:MAG: hypothetical protein ACI9UO_000218 [Nitrospinales bacterium]
MKLNFILIAIVLSIFANTPLSNAEQTDTSKCQNNEKSCRCDADESIVACKAQIPTAEANAKIKLLFGHPSNRYIAQNPADKNSCDTPKRCAAYLTTLKTLESEYQACQYAKKIITKAQEKKVRAHMSSMGMYPEATLDTHMQNRQSDESRWLICNYIVACEQGVTFLGQETITLCR